MGSSLNLSRADPSAQEHDHDGDSGFHTSSQRLATYHTQTLEASAHAVSAGIAPVSGAINITRPEAINVPFLQSGLQFVGTPPSPSMDKPHRSTAQRLADFHDATSRAMVQAAREGSLPNSPPKSL